MNHRGSGVESVILVDDLGIDCFNCGHPKHQGACCAGLNPITEPESYSDNPICGCKWIAVTMDVDAMMVAARRKLVIREFIQEVATFLMKLQSGDFGTPDLDDLQLAGKLHQIIEEYWR